MKGLSRPISTIVVIVAMLALGGAFAIFRANQNVPAPPHTNASGQIELFGIVA